MPVSAEDVRKAFNEKMKTLACPHCGTGYTDYAVTWSEAWREGRRDAQRELGAQERDGPVKLKCAACGGTGMTNAFLSAPRAV